MSYANDLKIKIVDEIIHKIETIPDLTWNKMLNVEFPRNLEGRNYNGANILNLNLSTIGKDYTENLWGTFKQILDLGGSVKKGEKASSVLFYSLIDEKDRLTGEKTGLKIPLLKEYKVFNIAQTTLEREKLKIEPIIKKDPEKLIEAYSKNSGVEIKTSLEGRNYYVPVISILDYLGKPSKDYIVMTPREKFDNIDAYYGTLFHEITHSTGHETRLNRDMSGIKVAGNESYAKEELIAELGSAFLMNSCGIKNEDIEKNNAAYLKSWLGHLKNDKTLLFEAAKHSMKAHDYVIEIAGSDLGKKIEKDKIVSFREFAIEPLEEISEEKISMIINDYITLNDNKDRSELLEDIGKENVIKAATYNPAILQEFSQLQNKEIISELMKKPNADIPGIMFFAGNEVQNDKEFIRELIKDKKLDIAMLINSASLEIQYDKEFKPHIDELEKYCKYENRGEHIENKIIERFPNIKYKLYNEILSDGKIFATNNLRTVPNAFVDPEEKYKIAISPKDESYFDFKIEKLENLISKYNVEIEDIGAYITENGEEKAYEMIESIYPEITRQYNPEDIVKFCIENSIVKEIRNMEVKSKKIEFSNEITGKTIYVEMKETETGQKEIRASQNIEPFRQEIGSYIKYNSIGEAATELVNNGFKAVKEENKVTLTKDYSVDELIRGNTKIAFDKENKEAKEIRVLDKSFNEELKDKVKQIQIQNMQNKENEINR